MFCKPLYLESAYLLYNMYMLIGLQTLRMSRDNLCSKPTMCRGLLISSAYISYVEKHACELGLISGTPSGYQLKVEIPALLKFHPHLRVKRPWPLPCI